MCRDTFGNLSEWDQVLKRIDQLKRTGRLDAHQDGLICLLRNPRNWRVREAALKVVPFLSGPTDLLIGHVGRILRDAELYAQVRVLAAQALGAAGRKEEARTSLLAVLERQDSPKVQQAARRALAAIDGGE